MNNMNIQLDKNSEIRWMNYISLYFIVFCLNLFLQTGLQIPLGTFTSIKTVLKIMLIIYLFYTIIRTKERAFFRTLIVTVLIVSILFIKSALLGYSQADVLKNNYFDILVIYIPLFVCALNIKDHTLFFEKFIKSARIIGVITALTMYLYTSRSARNYDSSSGYLALVVAVVLFFSYRKNKNVFDLILSIIIIPIALLFGSRGGLICLFGVGLFSVLALGNLSPKKMLFSILFFFFAILFVMNIDKLIALSPKTISSRNISVISGGNSFVTGFFDSNGRNTIWKYYWELSLSRPIVGSGIFGNYSNNFPHNIFLQILAAEGLFVGSLIIIYLLTKIIKPLRMPVANNTDKYIFLAFSVALFEVMLSTDFLLNEIWWVFLGVAISLCNKTKTWSYGKEIESEDISFDWSISKK